MINIFRKKECAHNYNPYEGCETVKLNSDIKHQNIGGSIAYIDRYVNLDDITEKILDFNIAAINFCKRRPDLFENISMLAEYGYGIPKKKAYDLEYYYVKINKGDDLWLGYFIASDEIDSWVHAKEERKI